MLISSATAQQAAVQGLIFFTAAASADSDLQHSVPPSGRALFIGSIATFHKLAMQVRMILQGKLQKRELIGSETPTWWSSSSKRDSLIMADREAPMPPVFMHSSTMMACLVFLMLLLMVSMSKGFRLIKSMTCATEHPTDDNVQC